MFTETLFDIKIDELFFIELSYNFRLIHQTIRSSSFMPSLVHVVVPSTLARISPAIIGHGMATPRCLDTGTNALVEAQWRQ